MMDFLNFSSVSFENDANVGYVCEVLNTKIGCGLWHDTFKIQNTKWLWPVRGVVAGMSKDKLKSGVFGIYPAYVAGILNSVTSINIYVLCSEKLNYLDYIKQSVVDRECTISCAGDIFQLKYNCEMIYISFETRIVREKLPSDLLFAYAVLKNIRLHSLAYEIVCVNRRITYLSNETLTSKHDCVSNLLAYDLGVPTRLADCKLRVTYCATRPYKRFVSGTLFCTKKSRVWFLDRVFTCRLCVKDKPPSLKSLCVNKLAEIAQ
jgi:hypothetical protein